MIELRWLERETGKRLMNEWGYYYPETVRELQYRFQQQTTDYSSENQSKVTIWSEWENIPIVKEDLVK